MVNKKRYYEFDILRSIATYSVIIIHITAIFIGLYSDNQFGSFIFTFLNRILKYTTPVFIFLAGMMVNLSGEIKKKNILSFYRNKFLRLGIPYLVFSFFYMFFAYNSHGQSFSFSEILSNIVYGKSHYHLYFLIILFQMYLITPIFKDLIDKDAKLKSDSLVMFFFISLYATLFIRLENSDRFFLQYIFFYLLGLFLGKDIFLIIHKTKSKLFFTSLWVIQGFLYFYDFYLRIYRNSYIFPFSNLMWYCYGFLSIIVLIMICEKLSENEDIKEGSLFVSRISFYIYFIHPYLIHKIYPFIEGSDFKILRFFIFFMLIATLSTFLAYLIDSFIKFIKTKRK